MRNLVFLVALAGASCVESSSTPDMVEGAVVRVHYLEELVNDQCAVSIDTNQGRKVFTFVGQHALDARVRFGPGERVRWNNANWYLEPKDFEVIR